VTRALAVDASAFVAVMLNEPEGDSLSEGLSGARLVVPGLVYFEVANGLTVKLRKRPENKHSYLAAYAQFSRVSVEIGEIDFVSTISLAQRQNLSADDASYAWLALSRGIELVTLDKRLRLAFEAEQNAIGRK
jgi:predicted nucleic acid-binding protein